MNSFSIQSFGCRVNQAESFSWANEFQKHGLKYEKDFSQSDLVVLNTCTLTSRADRDVRSFIRKVSRSNPRARMVVTGCFVERAAEELQNMSQVWKIFPNQEKKDLAERVLCYVGKKSKSPIQPYRSRALLKIQDGCSLSCAFCIIPSVRGKSVSTEKKRVLDQAKEFINQGFREIVLTGIHLCCYGQDLKPRSSLLDLLQDFDNLDGLGRVRLSSLDPRFLNESLLAHITASEKVCPHFHLSLQHGSNGTLLRMGRNVKQAKYQEILDYLRENSPFSSLGADIIVGFPGESESEFEQTYRFLEQSPLSYFHVFSYSPRPGTPAASLAQVEEKVKTRRSAFLRKLSKQKNIQFRRGFIGRESLGVVIKKQKGKAQVLTSNYLNIFLPSCPAEEKEEVRVRITRVSEKETAGEFISF